MVIEKTKVAKRNLVRGKLFGVVIYTKFDKWIKWKERSDVKVESSLKELKFPNRFIVTDILNKLEIQNVHKNKTYIDNLVGQLELGTKNSIYHYKLAICTGSTCTKKKILEALEEKIEGHRNIDIQFNFEEIKNYYLKKVVLFQKNIQKKFISMNGILIF